MILLYLFAFVVLVNCAYYLLFSKFIFGEIPQPNTSGIFPVSVIVCAKNEAENLKKHIPLWLSQNYPEFELILINDASSDDTLEVMESFSLADERIKVVDVENNEAFWANKKYALTLGIKKAAHKRLLFTDADCRPASKDWIREMAGYFSEEKQLVLGYGGYERLPGLLNTIIRFETLLTAIQYFSYAAMGQPYMGVGRNMGYSSNLYFENKGFASHMKVLSGDDDLFVNEVANSRNTAVCVNPPSFTYSIPKMTWKGWFRQKKRHLSTANLYKPIHKVSLAVFYIFRLLFWILLVEGLFFSDWIGVLALATIRFLTEYIVLGFGAKKFKERGLIYFLPILDLFLVFLQLSIFISDTSPKTSRWK